MSISGTGLSIRSHNPQSEATRSLIPHFGGNQAGTRSARGRNRCLMRVRLPTP